MIRLLLPIMLTLLPAGLLSVVVIAKLGFSNGSGLISHTHHDHEATSQRRDFALFEQPRRSLLANSTVLALVDSNNDLDNQCNRKCGDFEVNYPFGFSAPPCALTRYFQLECRNKSMFLTNVNGSFTNNSLSVLSADVQESDHVIMDSFQVLNITPGYMIIATTTIKAGSCTYASDWTDLTPYGSGSIQLPRDGPFRTSRNNVFFASGCWAQGISSSISDPFNPSENSSLASETGVCGQTACDGDVHFDPHAYCNTYDCTSCTSSLPSSLEVYIWGGGICGFAGILYPPTFPPAQLRSDDVNNSTEAGQYGLQLQWILEVNKVDYPDCSSLKNMPTYACSMEASCTYINEEYVIGNMSFNYTGYFCDCTREGYRGDGYTNGTGCKDIDECQSNSCNTEQGAKCANSGGSYSCSCPGDLVGDGYRNGTGCQKPSKSYTALISGLSAGGVFLFVIVNSLIIWYIYRKRQKDLQNTFFSADFSRRDFLLEIQSKEGANICKLFTYEELQKATDNFSPKMELGTGGFGTVFKGTLDVGTKLAIKKAKHDVGGGHNDTKQFINEVTVLSQVNHRNLVKLLGCCLETAVPVLVYEFIPNGNLFEHLRRDPMHMLGGRGVVDGPENKLLPISNIPPLNWNNRLKIAIGTAEALTYLHSGTSPPIYHRDVKTANILLDEKYNAKVADFGLSKFVPVEATHLSTAIQGTPGYLDPEYFDNCQITNKSDVYSFGVVLLELVTAEKPVDLSRQAGDQNLALRCNRLMKHGRFEDIIDPVLGASSDPKMLAVIHGVASVAMKCVERLRDDRPSMGEVLEELQSLRRPGRKDGSGFGFGKSVLGKSRSCKAVLGKSRSCKAALGKSISSKQVRLEETIMATPLLMEGTLTSSEDFYNRSDFSSTGMDSSSGSNGNLFTNGSGNVSSLFTNGSGNVSVELELLPR